MGRLGQLPHHPSHNLAQLTELTSSPPAVSPAHAQVPTLPGGWPLVGHIWWLFRTPLPFLERQRSYGDVVKFRLGRRDAYLINTPELTRELLVSRGNEVTKGPLFEKLKLIGGNGIATSEGDFQRRQRRLVQPAFHRERIASYARIMRDVALEKIAEWRDGQVVAGHEYTHDIATVAACRCLFSTDLGTDATRELADCLPVVTQGAARRAYMPFEWLFKLPTPGNRRFSDAHRRMHDCVDRLIARYRAERVDRDDVLSMLLTARDEHGIAGAMSDQQVHDEVLTLLGGAAETSSATILWVFYMLDRYRWAEQRVHAELDRVLGDRDPEFDDISQLVYLNRVITETMRLFPFGWLVTRSPDTDIQIGGYRIPAGATVFWSQYVLHRDSRSFSEPDVFDPDRWLPERATSIPRDAYLPFGLGGRMCIGKPFALMQIPIVVATIGRRWRLRLPANTPIRPIVETTLHPEPLPVTLERRR